MTAFRLLAFVLLGASIAVADRASAEKAVAEGEAALQRGNGTAALDAFSRAIEADPSWGKPWGRRAQTKVAIVRPEQSLEDFGHAIAREPDWHEWRIGRAQAFLYLDRPAGAVEDCDHMLKVFGEYPDALCIRGLALVLSGDVDAGLKQQDRALEVSRNDPRLFMRTEAYMRTADWPALVAEVDRRDAGGVRDAAHHFFRVVGLVEAGHLDRAGEAVAAAQRAGTGTIALSCRLYLSSTPGPHFNAEAAERDLAQLAGASNDSNAWNTQARALFLLGRPHQAAELLAARGRKTHFGTLFWLAASQWKLGRFPEARAYLRDARRLNPYLSKHAATIPGFADFAASVDAELASEKVTDADRAKLGHELATHLLTVAEIETLVRRYRFAPAVAEYERMLQTLVSAARRAEVEARLPEVRAMAGALAKLVAGVKKAPGKMKAKVGPVEITLQKADDVLFDFKFPKGEGRFPWAYLDPPTFCALALDCGLTPDETFGLGCIAFESGDPVLGVKLFEEAAKKKPALRALISKFVGRRRGMPAAEFVLFRGGYVTAEEKASLEKGLVAFEGQWVTPKDREMLAKGMTKVGEKWVPGDEAELMKRGYRKYKGQWMSREDYEELRSKWADAHVEETAHFTIKNNLNEAFGKELAVLAEAAYLEFKAFHAAGEPKEKMELRAFRSYEDYRAYCVETKAEDHLNAAGFARSDSNVVVGWNKTGNVQLFLQTMVHEAAHLFYFRVAPAARPASWYAEAIATYFEGFQWDGSKYKFTFVSETRLSFARNAMKAGTHIPIADLLGGDALKLINSDPNKALLFYAECWALNYFLSQTSDKARRDAWTEYRKSVAAGKDRPLTEFFPDLPALEKEWVAYVTGM